MRQEQYFTHVTRYTKPNYMCGGRRTSLLVSFLPLFLLTSKPTFHTRISLLAKRALQYN